MVNILCGIVCILLMLMLAVLSFEQHQSYIKTNKARQKLFNALADAIGDGYLDADYE